MTHFDVSLVGNLIVDNIHCVSRFQEGQSNKSLGNQTVVGSIANVLRPLVELNPTLSISVCSSVGDDLAGSYALQWFESFKEKHPTLGVNIDYRPNSPTSSAVILSDVSTNVRSSIVSWGACASMTHFEVPDCSWIHIMYGDKLDNLSVGTLKRLKQNSIVSMDFCLNKHSKEKIKTINAMLTYIDYAILSVDEAKSIAPQKTEELIAKKIGKLVSEYAIIHSPRKVYVSNGTAVSVIDTDYVEDKKMNVLGAGDMFAAAVIAKTLECPDIVKNVQFAHKYTTQKLMESYEKEI